VQTNVGGQQGDEKTAQMM
jgi:hypothetical protein